MFKASSDPSASSGTWDSLYPLFRKGTEAHGINGLPKITLLQFHLEMGFIAV